MHCFLPMVVPVVERLERRGCYMMSRTGSGCPWCEGSVRETQNERNYYGRALSSLAAARPPTREFASEAMSSSVRPNLTVYEASQFKR